MLERSSLPSSRLRTIRPFGRLRTAAGRHRTAWRICSAIVAILLALSLSPDPGGSPAAVASVDAVAPVTTLHVSQPGGGHVGVALPRTSAFPALVAGDRVHAVAVNDPLISGEVREPSIVIRDARVLVADDAAITIEATEDEAVIVIEAMTNGSVVLVAA